MSLGGAPGRAGTGSVIPGLITGAPEAAPAGLGPELVILLLRGLLAGAPEVGI